MHYSIGQTEFAGRRLEPGLYVVATPIGNLGDITLRALETLSSVAVVACEDTRITARLMARYGMRTRLTAYHEHNAAEAGARLIEMIEAGSAVALVSDAGTPLISDPGARLVATAREKGIPVWPIPGASAPVAALSASGFPSEAFLFAGFLPHKQGQRASRLRELAHVPATLAFFESPNRLARSLADIATELGQERQVAICREITKIHEEMVRGPAGDLAARYSGQEVRGEIVLLVAPPAGNGEAIDPAQLLGELLASMGVNAAAAEAARLTGRPKREMYAMALELSAARQG